MNRKTRALNRLNNRLDKEIAPENQEVFTDMICYLRGSSISAYHQEVVRQDLTEMLLSAQARGESIHSVIGEDYQVFCDNVIASLPQKSAGQKVIDCLDTLCLCLSLLGLINIVTAREIYGLVGALIQGTPPMFTLSLSVGSVVSMGVILLAAAGIVTFLTKNAFATSKAGSHTRTKAALLGGGLMAVLLLIAWLGRKTLFTVNLFVALAAVLLLYLLHKLLERL